MQNKIWSDCTKSSNALRPTKGNAIVFFNVHLNAAPDRISRHARCPVLVGKMWCATKLFRLQASRPEMPDLQSEDTDCTDEDENCLRWAAVGECQRNPVFMIGSPDYYGTCRKSCKSCWWRFHVALVVVVIFLFLFFLNPWKSILLYFCE